MFHTYILASRRNGTLYIGHTDALPQRIEQHQRKLFLASLPATGWINSSGTNSIPRVTRHSSVSAA